MHKDDIIKAINHSGFPLEVAVEDTIKRSAVTWRLASSNYSIQFFGKRGETDFILNGQGKRRDTLSVIECKKAHPEYGTWVFFNEVSPVPEKRGRCLYLIEERGADGLQFGVIPYDFPDIDPVPLMSQAVEVRTSGKKKLQDTERIYEACLQTLTNVFALASEMALDGGFSFNFVIPIIVTTAKLKIIENVEPAIDIIEGSIDAKKVKLKEVPFVYKVFAFPLAWQQHITRHTADSGNLMIGGRFVKNRSHILIVNAGHFEEFLSKTGDFIPDPRQVAKIKIFD